MTMGVMVRHEDHSYIVPPNVRPTRKPGCANKHDVAGPVHLREHDCPRNPQMLDSKGQDHDGQGQDANEKVDVEAPAPVSLCQRAANHGPDNGSQCRGRKNDAEIVPPVPRRCHVADDQLDEQRDAAASQALDSPASNHSRSTVIAARDAAAQGEHGIQV